MTEFIEANIGPSFLDELRAAGLGDLPIGWTDSRLVGLGALSSPQLAQLQAVVDAHDPSAEPAHKLPSLEPDQFWFGLRVSGHEEELRAWVASLNSPDNPDYDPVVWAAASAKLEFAKHFERDHPLVEAARLALGMSESELDDLWRYAAS